MHGLVWGVGGGGGGGGTWNRKQFQSGCKSHALPLCYVHALLSVASVVSSVDMEVSLGWVATGSCVRSNITLPWTTQIPPVLVCKPIPNLHWIPLPYNLGDPHR